MAHVIVEGALEVELGDEWDVAFKWDDCTAYRNGIHKVGSCKAVDVLAFSRGRRELLMLELKDFRGHRIENKDRFRDGALFVEVGHKIRDTIAGICGAARKGSDDELIGALGAACHADPADRGAMARGGSTPEQPVQAPCGRRKHDDAAAQEAPALADALCAGVLATGSKPGGQGNPGSRPSGLVTAPDLTPPESSRTRRRC